MDIADFNRRWLQEWTNKSVEGILAFYHPDILYFDENLPAGIQGMDALRAYLNDFFPQVPEWDYRPEAVWAIEGGFVGRWYMDFGTGAEAIRIRGFDQCILKDGLIVHNEVYTHKYPPQAAA
ncbi:MAG: nuclear transport factor 2 family protein [Sphingobium sp.]